MKRLGAICLLFLVAGCASNSDPQAAWIRVDGQPMASATSQRQLEAAQAICKGKEQDSAIPRVPIELALTGVLGTAMIEHDRHERLQDVTKGCMASQGYLVVKPGTSRYFSEAASGDSASGAIRYVPLSPNH
jgi:hypothetical protein